MATTTQQVAVLGTGTMGAGMARSLAREGHRVRVWNRTRSRAEALAGEGVAVADSVTAAVRGADVVLTILFDTDAVLAVADELLAALGPDAVWLQASTVGLEGIQRIGGRAGDARLVDAPVLGTKQPAENGQLVGLLSGPADAIEAAGPALDALTTRTVHAGDELGRASALKLVCNAWIGAITSATGQSVALAEALGLDAELFLSAISGGAVDAPYAHLKGKAMIGGDYTPSFDVDGALKDAGLVRDAIAGAGLRTELVDAVQSLFARASSDGHGGDDMAAVRKAF